LIGYYRDILSEKQQALQLLSVILKDYDFELPTQALQLASENRHPSVESIKQVFYQLMNGRGQRPIIQPKGSLPVIPNATRGLEHYDQLFPSRGGKQ
jgi:hypothetical protein